MLLLIEHVYFYLSNSIRWNKLMKKILFLLFALSVSSTILGIDFGSEYIKVALLVPGKSATILENTGSKRKTENVISFTN